MSTVRELRLVVTVDNYDEAVAFYGRRATMEIVNADQAEYIDQTEVGRRLNDVRTLRAVRGTAGAGHGGSAGPLMVSEHFGSIGCTLLPA